MLKSIGVDSLVIHISRPTGDGQQAKSMREEVVRRLHKPGYLLSPRWLM